MKIAVLHPGAMGVSVCQAVVDAGHEALWAKEGRSESTLERAQTFSGLDTLEDVLAACDGVVSVCPPHAALDLAKRVAASGYAGIYLDANAIAADIAV